MPGELSDLNHVTRFRQRQEVHAADRPSGLLYHCDRAQLASRRDLSHLTFRQHDNIPKTIQQCRYPGLITFLAKENRCICTLRVRGMRGNSQLLQQVYLHFARSSSSNANPATRRFAGAAHVDRAHRVCLACNSGAVGDEMHLVFECAALASLRSRYASLFTGSTDTMRSFFAQPDHVGVFHYVVDCLDFMMI